MSQNKEQLRESIELLDRHERMCVDLMGFFGSNETLLAGDYFHQAFLAFLERGGELLADQQRQLTIELETLDNEAMDNFRRRSI